MTGVQIENKPQDPVQKPLTGERRVEHLTKMLHMPGNKRKAAIRRFTELGPAAKSAIPAIEEEIAIGEGRAEAPEGDEDADELDYGPETMEALKKCLASLQGEATATDGG